VLTMEHFVEQFPRIDPNQNSKAGFWKGFMTAMLQLGALVGAAQAGWLADRISRKKALFVGFLWFLVGSALQTGSIAYPMLVVGRTIGGIGIGTLSTTAPLYISEISPPNVRGALLVLEEWSIVFGIVVAFYITYGTRFIVGEWSWRLPFLLQIAPALVLVLFIQRLPYSPRWLAAQGRDDEALKTLVRLRQLPETDERVIAEWIEMRAEAAVQKEVQAERHPRLVVNPSATATFKLELASWADTFRRKSYKRTLVGMGLMLFQQLVGINAMIYYGPSLFNALGLGYEMQLNMSGVMNILQLVGVTPAIFLMDRIGRRPLLLWGSAAMLACHVIIAAVIGTYTGRWEENRGAAWTGVAFIFVYMVAFGLSWGPVAWAMPAELFNSTLRAKGVALATCSNWFNNL
jgi:sugar porter (SP) family MFS transporter